MNVWPLVKSDEKFKSYMPSDEMEVGRFPDRDFFWGISFQILEDWSQQYLKLVMEKRNK